MTKTNKKTYSFIPQKDDSKDVWLKNFAAKLPLYIAKYNISAAEQADMTQSSVLFTYWLNYNNQLEEYKRKLAKYKNELRDGIKDGSTPSVLPTFPSPGAVPTATLPGIFVRASSIGSRIKKHHVYTMADGLDLGIETTVVTAVDLQDAKPVITLRLIDGGMPEIQWKRKTMDAIEIHVDRGDGYGFLAYDAHPHYTDDDVALEPGETAVYKYKAVYIKGDKRVGIWSDEVSITVTGQAA
jgi:hypothetical protein